ncbi:GRAM domain-containing protein 1B-like isoform X2 [Cimex lectularius]|uniref:GRAM domain-containing protein n=1 Tax=Cimex lectularius TaxID=79782 RepID=A0A8I6RIK7_CIMLE|nr:GRAM domain-containing protein 1B-like isoform X2 [Cimex lectularius]XP_024085560.1 GRAM domain-containing protein 1B-like isoform X2 [Cimex lectularius]
MVHPEIMCLVQSYHSIKFKSPSSKKKERFFGVLKRKSSGQLSVTTREDDEPPTTPATPPPAYSQHRIEMVPGGKGGGGESTYLNAQQCASAAAAAAEILTSTPGSSKARQKKFHRHFKTVPPDEKVLNYYSCALVADILLQGHLYITRNYFAFYSNVFGYVTKLLIPTSMVLKVTKEKTAYIIPNAVGITTEEDKHVFGSLLSRDSTYKLMVQVWNAALTPTPTHQPHAHTTKVECIEEVMKEDLENNIQTMPILQDEESSLSGSESNFDSKLSNTSVDISSKGAKHKLAVKVKSYHDMFSQTAPTKQSFTQFYNFLSSIPRPTLLLVISTLLLVILFASAAILLFRIARLQQGYNDESYFKGRSVSEVQAFINSNLEHISKVRQSLERLSFLIENGGNEIGRQKWQYTSSSDNYHQHKS